MLNKMTKLTPVGHREWAKRAIVHGNGGRKELTIIKGQPRRQAHNTFSFTHMLFFALTKENE